eukprot:GFUD01022131.1.p1 GENE.GFUD01022131.1~~GFUD01022131.1.p1  ORF type:complete len:300 (+),score=83.82 GFUD01022131.1:88-987(+)
MICLTNSSFKELNTLTDILNLNTSNLKFVTKDGTYCSQKLLILSAFPAFHRFLPDCSKCCEEVTIILPDESVNTVEESVVKMVMEGDKTWFENILGFKSNLGRERPSVSNQLNEVVEIDSNMSKEVLTVIRLDRSENSEIKNKPELGEEVYDIDDDEDYVVDDDDDDEDCSDIVEDSLQQNELDNVTPLKRKKKVSGHVCSKCGKTFDRAHNLKRHLKAMHSTQRKCERCGKNFAGTENLNEHIKSCWYHCEFCDLKSSIKKRFDKHMKSHKRKKMKEQPLTERVTIVYKYSENPTGSA